MCSRRHGEVVLEVRHLQKTDISSVSAKRNRRTTAKQVANQFLAASGKQISRKTVARRLRGGGLYARRPVVCFIDQTAPYCPFAMVSRSSDCRRQLIWRESGTAYRPENIQEKDRYPACSIMVWAGIMINDRTRLHVVANETMTGQRYNDEVLLPHVRLFPWCCRQFAGRNYPPTNKDTLIRALTEEWDKLPQQLLDNVVQSVVRRVECCITLHGGHIPY
ncbi:transposable element Tc1 transposase [Trichonephila clavipes]|nr:transposable element Tc1 transposase [Trichonephila clavipes]